MPQQRADPSPGRPDTSAAPDLRALTGYLLRRAFVQAVGTTRACLADDAELGQARALAVLAEHGSISQRRLGELSHVSPTLIVKLVDALEARGWVVRERSAVDRRTYALRLTASGQAEASELGRSLDLAESRLVAPLSPVEVDRLKEHLRRLLGTDPALDVASLSHRVGYLVAHAHRQLRERGSQRLAELHLHPRDFGVLATLRVDAPCSQARLAARLGVTPPAVLAMLEPLEARGLVSRVRTAGDRRVYDVTLTPAGIGLLQQAQLAAGELQAELVRLLGPQPDQELRDLLAKLID